MRSVLALLLLCLLGLVPLAAPGPQMPGQKPDGFLLHNGWRIAPAGIQVPLPDTFPMTTVMHPDGRYLFVLSAGYTKPSVLILDPANPGREGSVLRVALENAWLGLAIHPSGDRFYVPEGNAGTVREFTFTETVPKPPETVEGEPPPKPRPGTINVKEARGFKLFEGVGNPSARGNARWVTTNFLGDAAVHPDGRRLYVTDLEANLVYEVGLDKGTVTRQIKVGAHPYRILISGDGKRMYVSNWAEASITVINPGTGTVQTTYRTGDHPSDMKLDSHGRLYVACANTNAVYVHDEATGGIREQILIAMHPKSPPGSTPNALALSPDESRLYVANADNNAVAVVALGGTESRVDGFIPAGWYPTAVALSTDGRRLFVANGKGLGSYPNPLGPQPTRPSTAEVQYIARIQKGSLSIVNVPEAAELKILTQRTLNNSPYKDELLEAVPGPQSVIPLRPGAPTPIKYVLYIIKENRTYDQVLGDMKEGNGDPKLVLFGEDISPNHHKLAREFVLLDNFYVASDVSADGHNWSMGALANDYVQKIWPTHYGARKPIYNFEGEDPITRSPAGYLWDAARKAGITYRSYGEWIENGKTPAEPARARVPELEGHFDPFYRSFDVDYPEQKRVDEWLREFQAYEKNGDLPRLQIIRLPNDHTAGTRPGAVTPQAMVADNDLGLGRLVEAVTRSRYWKETAIFVLEDDAQNGPDHVDAHRSVAYVISSYTRRKVVDSTMYSTLSMLRTMELILGLEPMTQYDAGATPMFSVFMDKADLAPYTAAKPAIDLNQRNPANAPGAAQSARMDLSDVDRIDDDEMNEVLWRAIKGNTPMPAPVRSAFPWLRASAPARGSDK